MKDYFTDDIRTLLLQINNTVQEAHPDDDDDVGAIMWNCCYSIAQQLNIEL